MNWEKKFLSHKFNSKYRENYLLNYLFQCIASINDIFDDIQIFVEYRNQNVIHELIWHFDSNILSSYSEMIFRAERNNMYMYLWFSWSTNLRIFFHVSIFKWQ